MRTLLYKVDRFGQFPQLTFRGYPIASSFVGIMLTFLVIILLAVVFSLLMSTAVDTPTTTSFISPISFIDKLDLIAGDFRFCVVRLEGSEATEADLQNLFENELERRVAVYTLSEDLERVDRAFRYCPDKITSPVAHCICLDDESLMISPSENLHVKINLLTMGTGREFNLFLTTMVTALIPNKLAGAFMTDKKTYGLPPSLRDVASLSVALDRLIYTIDDNYFTNSPKTTYSVAPKTTNVVADFEELELSIQGWVLSFSGQSITSETTATKILSILAQVGALNGVFVIVFTVLFLPFFKLKYTENLLNTLNAQSTSTAKGPAKIPYLLSSEGVELQENSPKKRVQALVRQKTISKKPLYIGFWEWLCPCYKRNSRTKALQENEIAVKKYSEVASLVRTKMEVELLKSILLSPEQIYMLEHIPFESFALGPKDKNAQVATVTTERSFSDPFEFLRSQTSKEDMQSRFIEIMKKYYD